MSALYRILGKRGRITIPYEIRKHVGFAYNDILSFTESDDKKSVMVKRERICDHCRKAEPDGEVVDEVTLVEFLDGLSPEQQQAALVHLSVLWAEKRDREPL